MMALASDIDADTIFEQLEDAPNCYRGGKPTSHELLDSSTPYTSRHSVTAELPRHRSPEEGAAADAVAQMLERT